MKKKVSLSVGFTLVEILVSMAMLGVFLVLISQFLNSQSTASSKMLKLSDLNADARMTNVRMMELISQAAYIYPAGQVINLPGGENVTTGKEVLAFLLASKTPYCPSPPALAQRYCAVLYRIESRASYVGILGVNSKANPFVLTERVYTSFNWPQIPQTGTMSANWSTLTLSAGGVGLVADAVDNVNTDLGSAAVLILAPRKSDYDAGLQIGVATNVAGALINAVRPKIVLKLLPNQVATREFSVFAQPIPRQGPLDN